MIGIKHLPKHLLAFALVVSTCLSLALPSPKDIETEIQAGNLTKAESLLREVIAEKPQSAKAHYELGQVLARQERYAQAHQELVKAKDIDPTLRFASSPEKFNALFEKVNQLQLNSSSAPKNAPTNSLNQNTGTTSAPGINWAYVFLGIGGLLGIALLIRMARPSPPITSYSPSYPPTQPDGSAIAQRGFGQHYSPNSQPAYGPVPSSGIGSGIGGAVVGGLAGVAAGYALSKALEGDHSSSPVTNAPAQGGGYVPFDTPAQPDLGSFDSGSGGDSWDDVGSSGGDDSW